VPDDDQPQTDPLDSPQADQVISEESEPADRPQPAEADAALDEGPLEVDLAGGREQLQAELKEAKDQALRCWAELENYRKRAARQMELERRYANLPLIRDVLPVLDNMHRAIEAAEKTQDAASLLEGFRMVAGQLREVLERHHCTEVPALHKPFDPNLHEAVSQQPSDEHPANTVTHVVQTGFQLHDRVVRPSQVIVSTAVPEPQQEQ